MAPKIKLTYFDIRARAEAIRVFLAHVGADYDDNRINMQEEWPKMKPSKCYNASTALYMYLNNIITLFCTIYV